MSTMRVKRALLHLVKAGRDSLHLEKTLTDLGYKDTPYFNLYGEISEAMYCILEEDTDSFENSETYNAIHDIYSSDEMCAERLAEIFRNNPAHAGINIPKATMEVIREAAEKRKMPLDRFVSLILCEWAAREVMYINYFGE
jgi:hypothetical protein